MRNFNHRWRDTFDVVHTTDTVATGCGRFISAHEFRDRPVWQPEGRPEDVVTCLRCAR